LRRRNDPGARASDAVHVDHMDSAHPQLTKHNTIAELLATYPAAARILVAHRMHCVGCDIAAFETIADACVDAKAALTDLIDGGFLMRDPQGLDRRRGSCPRCE
jgi:hybrid cluster-associated redox disulfide protein